MPDASEVLELPTRDGSKRHLPGQIALAALPHLPKPKTVKVEGDFTLQTPRAKYRGFLDAETWVSPSGECRAPVGIPAPFEVVRVYDHKTTRALQWVKTPADLLTDYQSVLYAYAKMREYGVGAVEAQWTYILTEGRPRTAVSKATHTLTSVTPIIRALDELAEKMDRAHATVTNPLDLPPTPSACSAYGGCPHVARCGLTTADFLSHEKEKPKMTDIKALLAKRKAEKSGGTVVGAAVAPQPPAPPVAAAPPPAPPPPPPPKAAPPPAPVAHWVPGDPMNDTQKALAAGGRFPQSIIALAADNPPPQEFARSLDLATNEAGTINPPEAPPFAPPAPAYMPKPDAPPELDEVTDDLTTMSRDDLKALAISIGAAKPEGKERIATLRKLIREARVGLARMDTPVASVQMPAPTFVAPPAFEAMVLETTAETVEAPAPRPEGGPKIGTLYIDCRARNTRLPVTYLSEILSEVLPMINEANGVNDYREIPYKATGVLCAFVAEYIDGATPMDVELDSCTPEGAALLETLSARAGNVVRGY